MGMNRSYPLPETDLVEPAVDESQTRPTSEEVRQMYDMPDKGSYGKDLLSLYRHRIRRTEQAAVVHFQEMRASHPACPAKKKPRETVVSSFIKNYKISRKELLFLLQTGKNV